MSDENQVPENEVAPVENERPPLSEAEQASIAKSKEGLSEVNPNALPDDGPKKPEGVPDQFWSDGRVDYEGLTKSYNELRGKMDGTPKAKEPEEEAAAEAAGRPDGKIEKTEEAPEGASPLQTAMTAASDEWASTGEVGEETRASLEAAGIPKEIFDTYLAGIQSSTAAAVASIHETAGGEDAYNATSKWAGANLSEAEVTKFNNALDDVDIRETAVVGMMARFKKAVPSEGKLTTPSGGTSSDGDLFNTPADLVKAQSDPRYKLDASYRAEVQDRLVRSKARGFAVNKPSQFTAASAKNY